MAIDDVTGERVYYVPRELLDHNFVSRLRTLKSKKTFNNLKP